MILAKVVGNVWATRKHPSLAGKKMMLVKPVSGSGKELSAPVQMALDYNIGAGIGDTVLIIDEGSSCRQIMGMKEGPVRTIIAGIVDQVSEKGKTSRYH